MLLWLALLAAPKSAFSEAPVQPLPSQAYSQLSDAARADGVEAPSVFDGSGRKQPSVAVEASTVPAHPAPPAPWTQAQKGGDEVASAGFSTAFDLAEFPAYMMLSKKNFFVPFGALLFLILALPACVIGLIGIVVAKVAVAKATRAQSKDQKA